MLALCGRFRGHGGPPRRRFANSPAVRHNGYEEGAVVLTMRSLVCLSLALACLIIPVAHAATDAATAKTYAYPLQAADPAGDQVGPQGAPGSTCPECDMTNFEVTDDATALVMRATMAAVTFAPTGSVTVTVAVNGPGGEAWEITVAYDGTGKITQVADFDPSTGDPDLLMPGARAEMDVAAKQLYIFSDNAASGLAVGKSITIAGVDVGRGAGTPGVPGSPACASGCSITFPNRDTNDAATGQTYVFSNAAVPAPPGSEALAVVSTKTNATAAPGATVTFPISVSNVGAIATNFTMTASGGPTGTNLTFSPQSGDLATNSTANVVLTAKIPAGAANGPSQVTVTATGGKGTTKTLVLSLVVSKDGSATPSTSGGPGTTSGTGGTSSSGAGTGGPSGTQNSSSSKASPGADAVMLALVGIGAVLVARRRLE